MAGPRSAELVPAQHHQLSSPANAGDPVNTAVSMLNGRLSVLDAPHARGMTGSSLDRCVHQIAHHRAGVDALVRALRHEHGKQVLLRVDPEEGAGHAAPEELADRAEEGGDAGLSADAKAETEAVTRREQR